MHKIMSVGELAGHIESYGKSTQIRLGSGVSNSSQDDYTPRLQEDLADSIDALSPYYPQEKCGKSWRELLHAYVKSGLSADVICTETNIARRISQQCLNVRLEYFLYLTDLDLLSETYLLGPMAGEYHLGRWPYREKIIHTANLLRTGHWFLRRANDRISDRIWLALKEEEGELAKQLEKELTIGLGEVGKPRSVKIVKRSWRFAVSGHRIEDHPKLDGLTTLRGSTRLERLTRNRSDQDRDACAALVLALDALEQSSELMQRILEPDKESEDLQLLAQRAWSRNPLVVFFASMVVLQEGTARLCWGDDLVECSWIPDRVEKEVPICALWFRQLGDDLPAFVFDPPGGNADVMRICEQTPPLDERRAQWIKLAMGPRYLRFLTEDQASSLQFVWARPRADGVTVQPPVDESRAANANAEQEEVNRAQKDGWVELLPNVKDSLCALRETVQFFKSEASGAVAARDWEKQDRCHTEAAVRQQTCKELAVCVEGLERKCSESLSENEVQELSKHLRALISETQMLASRKLSENETRKVSMNLRALISETEKLASQELSEDA